MTQEKALFFDIENSPNLGFAWGKYEQNIIDYVEENFVLCISHKWGHEKTIHTMALPDFKGYKKNPHDDSQLLKAFHKILNEADVVIAHNGDRFDIRKLNARFIIHGLKPPKPYKTIDTLKLAKRVGDFNSNKLEDLATLAGLGKKFPHTGFSVWKGCMDGDKKSWQTMIKYNKRDVELLEGVYNWLKSWNHKPPRKIFGDKQCNKCKSYQVIKKGKRKNAQGKTRQNYQCNECGHYQSVIL